LNTCIEMNTDRTYTEHIRMHLSWKEDAIWYVSCHFLAFLREVMCKKHHLSFFVDSMTCVTIDGMERPCKSL
jgi:hypothetical protein